jgi:flagellar hook-length control protein FliK
VLSPSSGKGPAFAAVRGAKAVEARLEAATAEQTGQAIPTRQPAEHEASVPIAATASGTDPVPADRSRAAAPASVDAATASASVAQAPRPASADGESKGDRKGDADARQERPSGSAPHPSVRQGSAELRPEVATAAPAPVERHAAPPTVLSPGAASLDVAAAASGRSEPAHAAALAAALLASDDDGSTRLGSQIVQAIKLRWTDGGGVAQIRLQPDFLGDLTIDIRVDARGAVTAALESSTPAVREWIQGHEVALRHSLSEQDLRLERLIVREPDAEQTATRQDAREQDQQRRPPPRKRQSDAEGMTFEVMV